MKTESSYLRVCEVASLVNVSPDSVTRWIRRGQLPALKLGRYYRVRREDALRLLEVVRPDSDLRGKLKEPPPCQPALRPETRETLERMGLLKYVQGEGVR